MYGWMVFESGEGGGCFGNGKSWMGLVGKVRGGGAPAAKGVEDLGIGVVGDVEVS